jgi:hypothetical protein
MLKAWHPRGSDRMGVGQLLPRGYEYDYSDIPLGTITSASGNGGWGSLVVAYGGGI